MCKLIHYAVPEGPPYYASGPWRAVTKCEEHNCMVDGYFTQLPDQPVLCPIGRIEAATEEALCKIKAALDIPSEITPNQASS